MSVIDALRHRVHESFKSAAEMVIPVRSTSGFLEHGVLTPEEFVVAGDFLVKTCPTWNWEGGKKSKRKHFLPQNKQFLVTKNVPCLQRADILNTMDCAVDTKDAEELLEDDEWVAPVSSTSIDADEAEDIDQLSSSREKESGEAPVKVEKVSADDDEDDEDVPDMDDFDDDNIIEDVAALKIGEESKDSGLKSANKEEDNAAANNVLKTRTYDLSITYDKYYQTPRMWLIGYDEHNKKLEPSLCLEDVSHEHARKVSLTVYKCFND